MSIYSNVTASSEFSLRITIGRESWSNKKKTITKDYI